MAFGRTCRALINLSAKKKKKVRVAFRKNRQKRPRRNSLAWQALDQESESADLEKSERLTGKGELTRYRTIVGIEEDADDGTNLQINVDESKCLQGRVIFATGLNSIVRTNEGYSYECTVRRVLRTMARDERNAVVAGDCVLFQPIDEQYGVIERVNSRHGTISRGSHGREHVIVANVDQVLIVGSADEPALRTNLIDRFLISSDGCTDRSCVGRRHYLSAGPLGWTFRLTDRKDLACRLHRFCETFSTRDCRILKG